MANKEAVANAKKQAIAALNDLKPFLGKLNKASCQINLVKSNGVPNVKNTRYLDATADLANRFKETAARNLSDIIDGALAEPDGVADFNFQAFADERLAALPMDRFEEVSDWLALFPPYDQVAPLTGKDNHVDQLKFIHTVIRFKPNGELIRIFRKASKSKLAKQGVIARFIGDNKYDYVDAETSLIFDAQADFFMWDNIIYVSDYKKLESILDFRHITESVASGVCDNVFVLLPVTNQGALKDAVLRGARKLARMAALHDAPHLPKLDMKRIQKLINNQNLPITIIVVKGIQTLEVNPDVPDQVAAYMHILNDDYLLSLLTDVSYIGTEKEPL
jgi:hypothetical protein